MGDDYYDKVECLQGYLEKTGNSVQAVYLEYDVVDARDDFEEVASTLLTVATFAGSVIWSLILRPGSDRELIDSDSLATSAILFLLSIEVSVLVILSAKAHFSKTVLYLEALILCGVLSAAFYLHIANGIFKAQYPGHYT